MGFVGNLVFYAAVKEFWKSIENAKLQEKLRDKTHSSCMPHISNWSSKAPPLMTSLLLLLRLLLILMTMMLFIHDSCLFMFVAFCYQCSLFVHPPVQLACFVPVRCDEFWRSHDVRRSLSHLLLPVSVRLSVRLSVCLSVCLSLGQLSCNVSGTIATHVDYYSHRRNKR